jgi:Ca2+-binding RTX toxin-like protein
MSRCCRWSGIVAVFAAALGLVPGAGAAPLISHASNSVPPFGCRASGLRVDLGGTPIEPEVANASTYPCHTDSKGVASVLVPNGGSTAASAGPVGAFTYSAGSAGGNVAPGAAAVASIRGLNIPTSSGIITVVGPVQVSATYACVNDKTVGSGQSTLDVIDVNGKPNQLPAPGAPQTIQLGGGAYIAVNEQIKTATSITERALDIHLANGTDIIAGEAIVTQNGVNACQGTSGTPPILEICPPGSTLDVVHQRCIIILNGGKTIIYVSRPFKGPSGGTVVALSVARKRYHSPCLHGRGPKFALIATKRGGRVQGTEYSDRILARGAYERVAGMGGPDCIDGTGGNQRLFDGNGNDRVYASGGFNRIGVGNGNDYINGRNGRDWITAGNGNDTIHTGQGSSRVDAGIGRDKIFGGKGKNRIWVVGDHALVRCGSGKHNTAFVRRKAKKYALAHGCQHVHVLT